VTEAKKPKSGKRRACCLLLLLPFVVLGVGLALEHESAPSGTQGEAAERLAAEAERAVNLEAWRKTKALRWTFAGIHDHLWDRERNFARVVRGKRKVLLRLASAGGSGRAWEGERELSGAELDSRLQWAWTQWCNDSFWLNPVAKFRDPGTSRFECGTTEDGGRLLMVSYDSGGVTPGDRYVWELDPKGLPKRWKMWVSILPVGGVDATWEGWETLSTGAKVATDHELLFGLRLKLTGVEGALSLEDLEPGPDPFQALVE
jgi:hypothetical protein